MNEENGAAQSGSDPGNEKLGKARVENPEANSVEATDPKLAGESSKPSKPLTPEEQMELYEKDLKENDWGHQPC